MQIQARCVSCLLSRAFQEVQLATDDATVQLSALTEVVKILNHSLTKGNYLEKIPAYVGTLRDHTIQRITGCQDPFAAMKKQSNESALRLRPSLEAYVSDATNAETRFRRACLVASLGNIIEYGVEGHEIPWDNLDTLVSKTQAELAIDQIKEIYQLAKKGRSILFLTDNSGEVVFDRILVQVIAELGGEVTVAVKGAPVLNDAMLEDAKTAQINEYAKVVTTGGGAVGVLPQWCSREFLDRFASADFIIAKGMGHAETLPEFNLPKPTALLLRTKCDPVASFFNVPKGRNIAKLLVNNKGRLGPL
ncbi:MAG: DUF89 domain-containing protein [Promethearchaeota archaeon]